MGAPLFYDLFMRPGAIYWLKKDCGTGNNVLDPDNKNSAIGWDFNYFTFDFFPISWGNVFGPDETTGGGWLNRRDRSDACFVRCVEK